MAIYLRIRKVNETATHVEYALLDADGQTSQTLVIDKRAAEAQLEALSDPQQRRALTMAVAQQRRTGEWPDNAVKQS